jgi:hypothetical protein
MNLHASWNRKLLPDLFIAHGQHVKSISRRLPLVPLSGVPFQRLQAQMETEKGRERGIKGKSLGTWGTAGFPVPLLP